jgi:hypothetical protein
MKWYNNYLWLGMLLVLMNSNHAMSKRPDQPNAKESKPITVTMNEKNVSTESPITFLDTLNKGKEISLTDKDLNPIMPESSDATAAKEPNDADIDGFRIQCLASSQIERIRSEQKLLEPRVKYPIYLVFNAPYYKLMIGDFIKRADADIILTRLKEMGYNDAWVVRSRVNPPLR